jgi:hypothetical protein
VPKSLHQAIAPSIDLNIMFPLEPLVIAPRAGMAIAAIFLKNTYLVGI